MLELLEVNPFLRAIAYVICAACSGLAQQKLTFKDAVQEALSRHPMLAAAGHRVVASEALVRQAGLKPNPRAILQVENLRTWGQPGFSYPTDSDNFAYLSQRVEVANKRERRVELAQVGVQLANLDRQVAARDIVTRVAASYWSAVASAALRELLRDDLRTFEGTVQYHRDRVREGAMAEVDLVRVLLERDRLAITVRSVEQEAAIAILTLLREVGRTDLQPVELADKLPDMVPPIEAPDVARALNSRPEILAARAAVQRARANLSLQRANAKPDPEALFGYKRTAGFDTLIAGVQVEIPFRNRNQGAIGAAAAEVKAAESTVAAIELRVRGEIAAAYAEYSAKQQLIRDTLGPMRERAEEVARIVRAAYREGGMDLLRVIDAERYRIDALVAYHRALADYQQRVTALQLALGETP